MYQSVIWLIAFLLCTSVYARFPGSEEASTSTLPRQYLGFNIGYGNQEISGVQIDTEHDYEVVMIQGQYHFEILRKKSWNLELVVLPQLNYSKFFLNSETTKDHGYELGVGFGLLFRKIIVQDQLDAYLMIASGPHYVSGVPERQDSGFIFSDVVAMGFLSPMFKDLLFNLKIGLRHMSNAGLKPKNAGVNNLIVSAGLLYRLQNNK